ncbi:MAG: hypothetical protein Q4C91_02470 [Eubacteriales bacterium]|nr:hypothetical protein [Eubacteriales bacterium]
MEIREESGLKFGFPDDNIAIKFDDTKYYRDLFNALSGSKGVDFISVGKDTISFIEVKIVWEMKAIAVGEFFPIIKNETLHQQQSIRKAGRVLV